MTKKTMMIAAMAMVMGLSTTAMAETITEPPTESQSTDTTSSGKIELEYVQPIKYTVTIPANITFSDLNEKKGLSLNAENVVIPHGQSLKVSVSGKNYANGWKLADTKDGGDKLDYTFTYKEGESGTEQTVNPAIPVLTVNAGTATGATTLNVTGPNAAIKSGTYKDTLTFTVAVN